jgi:hypothetical protein
MASFPFEPSDLRTCARGPPRYAPQSPGQEKARYDQDPSAWSTDPTEPAGTPMWDSSAPIHMTSEDLMDLLWSTGIWEVKAFGYGDVNTRCTCSLLLSPKDALLRWNAGSLSPNCYQSLRNLEAIKPESNQSNQYFSQCNMNKGGTTEQQQQTI